MGLWPTTHPRHRTVGRRAHQPSTAAGPRKWIEMLPFRHVQLLQLGRHSVPVLGRGAAEVRVGGGLGVGREGGGGLAQRTWQCSVPYTHRDTCAPAGAAGHAMRNIFTFFLASGVPSHWVLNCIAVSLCAGACLVVHRGVFLCATATLRFAGECSELCDLSADAE